MAGLQQGDPRFLVLVAARLREYDEGEAGRVLAAVMPDRHERMVVALQAVLLGALAVVQEWNQEDNPGGEVGFRNIRLLRQGLLEAGMVKASWQADEELPQAAAESHGRPGWGRGSGCEEP